MTTKTKKPNNKLKGANDHLSVSNRRVSAPGFGSIRSQAAGVSGKRTPEVVLKPSLAVATQLRKGATESTPMKESEMLDAYWASYGTDAERAAQLKRRRTEGVIRAVIGDDDRVQVGNTNEYPWRCIASLRITAANGSGWIGTGWLVGPRILLTAGHNLYMHNEGGWAQQIEVIPGRAGDNFPFGSCIATDYRSVQGWTRDHNSDYDYGVILLPADQRLGDQLGWFGYQMHTKDELSSYTVNIAGYPGDKPVGTQWWMSGTAKSVTDRNLVYEIDTYRGQSGCPVWIQFEGENGRYGIAVHNYGGESGNSATRIIQEVFDNVANWSNEVP